MLCALGTEKTSQAESLKLLFIFRSTSPCLQLSSTGFEGLVAAGHVYLGLAALPSASQLETKGWALCCCGSSAGVMWVRALIRVDGTIPISDLGSFLLYLKQRSLQSGMISWRGSAWSPFST